MGYIWRPGLTETTAPEPDAVPITFGYTSKLVGLDHTVHYLDYVVFMPQTAKNLTEGRVYPAAERKSGDPGGIIRVPTRANRNPATNRRLLRRGGQQIADRIKDAL
jgi:hypothetical protein